MTIFISFESSQRALEVEHNQSENLENVQFRTIKFFFTNPFQHDKIFNDHGCKLLVMLNYNILRKAFRS